VRTCVRVCVCVGGALFDVNLNPLQEFGLWKKDIVEERYY